MQTLRCYYGFESYWEFEAFDTALAQQLATGQLLAKALSKAKNAFVLCQPDACYQFADTQELWVLSTPDNAWRGYFLPLAEAAIYQQKLRARDRRGRLGCVALLLLTVAILIWQAINLFLNSLPIASP